MDVVIVVHNTREDLRACLESVQAEPAGCVVVVDNASTDGSAAMVRSEFPDVVLSANAANPGYGAAANQGLALCRDRYALLLNSDTLLRPGALRALDVYLDRHRKAAIVGPRLLNPDGSLQPSCYAFPTPLHVLLEESTLIRLIGRLPVVRNLFLRTHAHDQNRVVPWVLGAALAIRRSAFDALGGFDPSFFLYAEEIDLCYRLRAAGWQTHFTPTATVVHVGGASTRQRRAEMAVQFLHSLAHFYRRHYSGWRLIQLQWTLRAIILARWARATARLHWGREESQRVQLVEDRAAWRRWLATRDWDLVQE